MTSVPGKPGTEAPGRAAPEPRRVRASDADRAAVVGRLQEAVGRGLLTFDEGGERIAAAFAARFLDELDPLTGDLPEQLPAGASPAGWRALGRSLLDQLRAELQSAASAGVRSRRFLATVVVVLVVAIVALTLLGAAVHGLADVGDHRHLFPPPPR